MVMKKLRDSNCQRCPLWEGAETVCIWGKGTQRDLMVVLESPSRTADRGGPFIGGPAGKTLLGLLSEIGVTDPYVTHAMRCLPPEGESPGSAELKACKDFLLKEIERVKPKFILTLGAGPLKALSRGKITEVHGNPIELTVGEHTTTLYPTFHPAVALRDPTKLIPLRQDIARLGKLMRGEQIGVKEIHWDVVRTMTQWNNFIEEFTESPEVSIDTETTGLDRMDPVFEINALQIGLASGRNFAIPFMVRDSPWQKKFQRIFLEQLIDLAEDKICVFQNGKFDNLNLRKKYGMQFKNSFDIMLAHHLLDENAPHGLDSTAQQYLDAPNWDVDLQTKLGLGDLTKFYKYGCEDVYYTLQLYYIFRAMLLKQPGLRRLFYKLVMPIARTFEDIEERGIPVDLERLNQVQEKLTLESQRIQEQLNEVAQINWNSPKQIGKLFFEDLGMPVLETTPGGEPSTAESTLLRLEHPVAKKLMEYRGIEKNLSTYILGWQGLSTKVHKKTGERTIVQGDERYIWGDRLYLSTKLHGTVTGRYASRLHQVPRDGLIRSIINSPTGKVLVVADYSQIELRLAAEVSGDNRMKMIFQTGGDIHAATASEVLGMDAKSLTKEQRKKGKPINFGFLYGMWWKKFKIYARDNYGVEFTDKESESYRERFFEIYSALPKWHQRMKRTVNLYGQVESLSGRIRHLPGVNSSDKSVQQEAERQAINSPIQGFGSGDLKAMAMVEIDQTLKGQVEILGEVHDSILFLIDEGTEDEILPQVKKIMECPRLFKDFKIRMTVPLVADFEVGRWSEGKPWVAK